MIAYVVHSGLLIAGVAVALVIACAAALGGTLEPRAVIAVATGTLAVYAFDRRVDDRVDRPEREGFVLRNRGTLGGLAVVSGVVAVVAGLSLGVRAVQVFGGVVALAVVHSRLRHIPWLKPLYIALAWLGVAVALPAVLLEATVARAAGELLPIGLAIVANVIACDAADREAEAAMIGTRGAWWVARGVALTGVLAALLGPVTAEALALVPGAVFLVLVPMRPHPDYTPALDAALGVGGVLAWIVLRA